MLAVEQWAVGDDVTVAPQAGLGTPPNLVFTIVQLDRSHERDGVVRATLQAGPGKVLTRPTVDTRFLHRRG